MQDRFRFRYYDNDNRMHYFTLTNCYYTNIEPPRLMQCTGLKDKTGKLIFEGDIVKIDNKIIVTVIFQNGGYFLQFTKEKPRFLNIGGYDKKELEVIGNIYEHPELLTEEVQA